MKFFKNNIHTLLLLTGFGLIDYSFFRLDLTAGFMCLGLMLAILGMYIDKTKGQ
ncbi:hypothetical protein KJW57_00120 [Streptococcus lutetiensis]|uniref:hypothetical protein n=1 Tax=Streptococcus lutetiensis TaxID=150055 RepID=UPI001BDA1F27|nr:hypothetical protein [Streptococcus lutetiensis]MBT0897646.1 hypothetical protein [Streptococcus lutetiensis]MBT1056397.1 hypothetical protein [Streptococcus lutetiensis]MBT1058153.1 hypothetical protein [Streptococcus lutetiensis]